jgi:hypothetical protein
MSPKTIRKYAAAGIHSRRISTGWQVVRLAIQEERARDMVGVNGHREIESPDTAIKLRGWLLGHAVLIRFGDGWRTTLGRYPAQAS